MTYGDSWVSLCNRALARIGTGLIQSLTTEQVNVENARLCSLFLPEVIGSLLSQFDWKFSIREVELPRLEGGPPYTYPYPEGFARAVAVVCSAPYEFTSTGIRTVSETLTLTYVELPQEPDLIPPHVGKAISAMLAAEVAQAMVANEAVIARIRAEAVQAVERAKTDDQAGVFDSNNSVHQDHIPWYEEAR